MIVAVASGKGGTGKTTVSVNLVRVLGSEVRLLDCDVEEPNCHIFLKSIIETTKAVGIPIPVGMPTIETYEADIIKKGELKCQSLDPPFPG